MTKPYSWRGLYCICVNIYFFLLAGIHPESGCSCCLCLCQCFLSVLICVVACMHTSFSSTCIYICTYCTSMLSLTTIWSWRHRTAAALPLLGYGIQWFLPPCTIIHRTTPIDKLRKPNLLITLPPLQVLSSLWDTERGFTFIGRTKSHSQMPTNALWGAGIVWLGKLRQMMFPKANRSGAQGPGSGNGWIKGGIHGGIWSAGSNLAYILAR